MTLAEAAETWRDSGWSAVTWRDSGWSAVTWRDSGLVSCDVV